MIKKIAKFFGWLLLILSGVGFVLYLFINKPLPNGTSGDQAEMLADEMLAAINKQAYDSIEYIGFTFKGLHRFKWNRKSNNVTVFWEGHEVNLDLNASPEEYTLMEFQAYKYFVNDSFWLVAPFKVRDSGVVRSYVDMDEGRGLLVTYTSGGVTPGDSYLWILDDDNIPIAWKLWTSIVPIGGLKFSWENWVDQKGALFSTKHQSFVLDLDITDLEIR